MTDLSSRRSAFFPLARCVATWCLAVCCSTYGQDYSSKEIRINDLPSLTARSRDLSEVLATSAEIIFQDKAVCCGKNSALEDDIQRADPKSLKDVAAKLEGRHLLSDGRPIMVTAEYVPAASVNSGALISALTDKRAPLMEWNSHLYVVYGANFVETVDSESGAIVDSIRTLLLLDARFSNSRREVAFNRQTDDWSKVQGVLMLKAAPQ